MAHRPRAPRRVLPYVRSAVLETGDRTHIVTITDISTTGAFLATRVAVDPDQALRLRVILPGASGESVIRCRFVRWGSPPSGTPDSPRRFGLAVRFEQLAEGDLRLLRDYAARARGAGAVADAEPPSAGGEPFAEAVAGEPLAYRVLLRPQVDEAELNRLGAEGWELAAALPHGKGVQLVLLRRR